MTFLLQVKASEYSLGPFFRFQGLRDYFALGLKAFSRCS